jgi:hypothetical protein
MYQKHQFATPAIVLQLILIMGSLSIIFKTFIISIQLYPKESRKRLVDAKNYKNRIQLLCANSDPMNTIVAVFRKDSSAISWPIQEFRKLEFCNHGFSSYQPL